jgi:hypothetical protein
MMMKKENFIVNKIRERNRNSYLLISFAMGMSSLGDLAIQYFFKDDLKIEPYEMSRLFAIIMIPWIIKPLLGLLTDLVPIFGFRRKMYLIISGILSTSCFIILGLYAISISEVVILLFLINLCFSFASVIGEAIVVELSSDGTDNNEKAKDYVSLFFLTKNTGGLISAFFRGFLLDYLSIRQVFLICSFIPLLILISAFVLIENLYDNVKYETSLNKMKDYYSLETTFDEKLIKESQPAQKINKKELLTEFFQFINKKEAYIPALIAIILFSTPSFGDPMFYYMTNFLHFSPTQLGIISLVTSLGVIIAILSYRHYFKTMKFVNLVNSTTLLYLVFSFMAYFLVKRWNIYLGISDFLFCNMGFFFLTILVELSMLPLLTLACMICPKRLEATIYSYFMSAINTGAILSNLNSSFLTSWMGVTANNFDNFGNLIIISSLLKIIPVIVIINTDVKYLDPIKTREINKNLEIILEDAPRKESLF